MNAEQLKTILREYPSDRGLSILVDGRRIQETTVGETIRELRESAPDGGPPHIFTTIFGRDSCIIRERFADATNRWLEIDLR
jgi:hypothetical protein